jgi:hypothetical protein
VSDEPLLPGAPGAFDVVEIVHSAARISAVVESAGPRELVLRVERASRVPEEAQLCWFDGSSSWQVPARLSALDETRVGCELAPEGWAAAPARPSLRALTDNTPLRIRVVESTVFAPGRHIHALALDVSDGDCRVSWPGPAPCEGDTVEIAWERGDWRTGTEPGWIPARVQQVIPRPFATRHVCLAFETADATHAATVRKWFLGWLRHPRPAWRDPTKME